MQDRVVILGGGNLGKELKRQRPEWDLITQKDLGISWSNESHWPKMREKMSEISTSARYVINTVAYTETYGNDWETAYTLNVFLPMFLSENCLGLYAHEGVTRRKTFIHISTDYVYANGGNKDYPAPLTTPYGFSKALGDTLLRPLSGGCETIVVRGSFKPKPWPWHNAFSDVIGNFLYIDEFASRIVGLIDDKEERFGKVYHIGSERPRSLYEMAKETRPEVVPSLAPPHFPKNVLFPEFRKK